MVSKVNATGRIPAELFRFLRELKLHNDRDWFLANKERYERLVRDPCVEFVRWAAPEVSRISPHLVADPRPVGGSISRIYRDIRFSKDKTPYKTHVGIHFFHDRMGKSEAGLPGFYVHLEPGDCYVGGGVWHPEPPALARIRHTIVARPGAWASLVRSVPPMSGESLKRPPPGFDPTHRFVEDLKRKDFLTGRSMTDAQVTAAAFPSEFLKVCRSIDPLNRFLAGAAKIPY